jgi:phospholipid transport system substrate-binding protein
MDSNQFVKSLRVVKRAPNPWQAKARRVSVVTVLALLPAWAGISQAEQSPAVETKEVASDQPAVNKALDDTASPEVLIEKSTNMLVKELLIGSKLDKEEQPQYYRKAVDEIVAPYIDFELIAKRVMSRHYRLATPKQRAAFAEAFEESLLDTYTQGITGYSDEQINMLPFEGVRVSGKSKIERAKVEMEIRTKEGDVIPIIYQVYKNDEGRWRLENMILSGVNLGLTYRNQFNEALKRSAGNIDKVINDWNVKAVDEASS